MGWNLGRKATGLLLVLSLGAAGCCGKEAGKVPFAGEGSDSATLELQAGEVGFWTDIDLEYEGDARMSYVVELDQGGTTVATVTCDPLGPINVKMMWVETNVGSSHSRRGSGKLGCSTTLAKGGTTRVKATLKASLKPAKFTMRKADLVLKQ